MSRAVDGRQGTLRPRRRNAWALISLTLPVVLAAAACSSGSSATSSGSNGKSDFVVATVQSESGPFQTVGQAALVGLEGEAALLNKQGGILGHHIVIVNRDDGSDIQRGISATQQLLSTMHVNMFEPDAANTDSELPFLSHVLSTGMCPETTCGDGSKYPYYFTMNPPIGVQIPPLVAYAQKLGYTKIGILAQDTSDGQQFASVSKADATKAGMKIVSTQYFDPTATDITPQVQQLKAAGTQAIFGYTVSTTIGTAANALQDLGWKVPLIGVLANFTGDVNTLVPNSVKSQVVCLCYAVGARPAGSTGPGPIVAPLINAMKPYGLPDSLTVAALAADSLGLAAYGYEQAGSLNYQAAAKAIEQIGSHQVPSGLLWVFANTNPRFTATEHSPINADYGSGFFAVVKPSPIVDGTYVGTTFKY